MKRKICIIFKKDIHYIGGVNVYAAGKAQYLQQHGWEVFIFFVGSRKGKAVIPSLTQFIPSGGGLNFLYPTPPYKFSKQEQEQYLNEMVERLGKISVGEDEIIIESHADVFVYWAELLAAKIGARHFFFCCEEKYRSLGMTFKDNLDFFYFKWQRNEIVGSDSAFKFLFNGYKNVTSALIKQPWVIREQDPVQDVDFPIEKISRLDWNICHIGREAKAYLPFLITDVGELARRHPDKKINLIMVGNVFKRREFVDKTFSDLPNVSVTYLGAMFPIPRILFSKVDVVCAMAQTALFVANENVLTICGSAVAPRRTPGVLGYDTEDAWYGKGTFSFVDALERVLVKKLYDGKKSTMPKLHPAEEAYEAFWTIVNNAAPVKEYFTERLSQPRIRDWTAKFPFDSVARDAKIILFGETDITEDYRTQIRTSTPPNYCKVVATVDEHPEEFDNAVVGMERLKTIDYDAIVICLLPEQAQAVRDKIVQVVPDMASKIVYDFQKVPV